MSIDKLLKGYAQSKRHIASAVLGAAGWDMRQFDNEVAAGPAVFVYYFDKPTGFIWMAQMDRKLFVEVSTRTSRDMKLKRPLSDALYCLTYEVTAGKPPAPVDGLNWEEMLSILLAAYAGTTGAWKQGNGMREGGHFIVLNYRNSATAKDSLLRPFALTNTGAVLPADGLQGYIQQVMQMDRVKHPEWFK